MLEKLKNEIGATKISLLLAILLTLTAETFGQVRYSLESFYGKELTFTEGWLGADSVQIDVLEMPDTTDLWSSPEKLAAIRVYTKLTRFSLGEDGAVTKFAPFIYCPVGEWIPDLYYFEILENKVLMFVEYKYDFQDMDPLPRHEEHLYNIESISNNQLVLTLER